MNPNNDLIEFLIEALSYSDEKDFNHLFQLLCDKIESAEDSDDPRLKYLITRAPDLGRRMLNASDKEFDAIVESLLNESASAGVPEAQYEIGNRHYEVGQYAQAVRLYELAANQGYPPAQYTYGLDLVKGVGVAQDQKKGLHFIELSAGRLNVLALEFLIDFYREDRSDLGIKKWNQYSEMLGWCRK